jgi:hypothetical protein
MTEYSTVAVNFTDSSAARDSWLLVHLTTQNRGRWESNVAVDEGKRTLAVGVCKPMVRSPRGGFQSTSSARYTCPYEPVPRKPKTLVICYEGELEYQLA